MKEKIVIVNAHWSNRGDEAAIAAIINRIREIKNKAEITILFKDDSAIQQFIPEWIDIQYESNKFLPGQMDYFCQLLTKGKIGKNQVMKRCITFLLNADYIIYAPGGSVINDRFWWRKQLEYMLPFWCSKLYKIPFFIAAPSVGPYDRKYWIRNSIRRMLFNDMQYFCVREIASKKYLANIHADKKVVVTVDSAFCSKVEEKKAEGTFQKDRRLKEFFHRYQKNVGITITDLQWNIKYKENKNISKQIKDCFQKFIKYLLNQQIGVILIPQLFGNQKDSLYLENFQNVNVMILNEAYDSNFQQYLIGKLYMVVGMRYHSNIFSAKMCTPFLPIIYEEKLEAFLEEANLMDYAVDVKKLDIDSLIDRFCEISDNYSVYKEKLVKKSNSWHEKAEFMNNMISDFLKERK